MEKIWANRLVSGDKVWEDVPLSRRKKVMEELRSRIDSGNHDAITREQFETITGEIVL